MQPLSDADLKQDRPTETPPDLSTPGQRGYLQSLLSALQSIRGGDFSVRMPGDSVGRSDALPIIDHRVLDPLQVHAVVDVPHMVDVAGQYANGVMEGFAHRAKMA